VNGAHRVADALNPPEARETVRLAEVALLASVFVVAACGLVYELAAGTLASYLLGDSILQFSTVIGTCSRWGWARTCRASSSGN
jgi:hypothetical protein